MNSEIRQLQLKLNRQDEKLYNLNQHKKVTLNKIYFTFYGNYFGYIFFRLSKCLLELVNVRKKYVPLVLLSANLQMQFFIDYF